MALPSMKWVKDRLLKFAKNLGVKVTTKNTKPEIFAKIQEELGEAPEAPKEKVEELPFGILSTDLVAKSISRKDGIYTIDVEGQVVIHPEKAERVAFDSMTVGSSISELL